MYFFSPPVLEVLPLHPFSFPTSPVLLYPCFLFFLASHSFFLCRLDPNPSILPASPLPALRGPLALCCASVPHPLPLLLVFFLSLCLPLSGFFSTLLLLFPFLLFSIGVHLLSDCVIPVQQCVRVGEEVGCTVGVGVLICCTTASSWEALWGRVVGEACPEVYTCFIFKRVSGIP